MNQSPSVKIPVLNRSTDKSVVNVTKPSAKEQIMHAARKLFNEVGYRKTSVNAISNSAGVSRATVYVYYRSKAELLVSAIAQDERRFLDNLETILQEELPGRERLKRYLRMTFMSGTEMPMFSRLLAGDQEILTVLEAMDINVREDAPGMHVELVGEMLSLIEKRQQLTIEELNDQAKVIIGLVCCSRMLASEKVRGGVPLERFAGILADIIVDGIV